MDTKSIELINGIFGKIAAALPSDVTERALGYGVIVRLND